MSSYYLQFTEPAFMLQRSWMNTKPKSKDESYAMLNDSVLYVGGLMQADGLTQDLEYKALNGQDFLWVSLIKYS